MRFSAHTFLAISIPTLWIYYTFVSGSLRPFPWYREAFGNKSTYLDLYFETNPYGKFLGGQPVGFDGYLFGPDGEQSVSGTRFERNGKTWYRIRADKKVYLAELRAPRSGCEPALELRSPSQNVGVLRAAFCP